MPAHDPLPSLATPDLWLLSLREAYATALEHGTERWKLASEAAAEDPRAASQLAHIALCALGGMQDTDSTLLGMAACEALRRFGSAEHLEPLRALQDKLPSRPGLRDWRADALTALEVMEARAAGRCTCASEASRNSAPYGEQWEEDAPSEDAGHGSRLLSIRCRACGSRWQVRRDDSYHYPLFSWSQRSRADT